MATEIENLEVKNRILTESHKLLISGLEHIIEAMGKSEQTGVSMDYTFWLYATHKIIDNAKNIIK